MSRSLAALEAALRTDPNDFKAFSEYVALLKTDPARRPEPVKETATPQGPTPRNPTMEARLIANPRDGEAWQVYLDWLLASGHYRGELGAVQLALAGPPSASSAVQLERELELLAVDGAMPASVREASARSERPTSVSWKAGFIESAALIGLDQGPELETQLRDLLAHDAGRFLCDLTVGTLGPADHDYRSCVAWLAEADVPLRRLFLADFDLEDSELSWSKLGDLAPLWQTHRRLEEVVVRGGTFELGELDLPHARAFSVRTGGLSAANLRAISSATWPALQKLEIWFGSRHYGGEGRIELLDPVLMAVGFDTVTDLGLMNAEFADAIAAALPGSPIAAQIERLDLSMGILTNRGADALARGAATFEKLASLDVSDNYLGPTGAARLSAAFAGVKLILGAQQGTDDPVPDPDDEDFFDDRYVQVGE